MTEWKYKGETYAEIKDKRHFGFIYEITNKTNGKKYIGQKSMYSKRGSYFVESGWQDYTGSNDNLNHAIKTGDEIEKNILRFCLTKAELNYFETKEILQRDALLDANYYNDWVSVKVTRKHLRKVLPETPQEA